MAVHLQHELAALKRQILTQSALVEDSVQRAIQALERGDIDLANAVVAQDKQVNLSEVELEENCLKVLALHQPVATDLRFIVSIIKINSDLERMADVAVNIARRTLAFAEDKRVEPPFDCPTMGRKVLHMLKESLEALVNLNAERARAVIRADDAIDVMHRQTYSQVKQCILQDNSLLQPMLLWLAVSRHLERIADLSVHIAEDVVYLVDGVIVRHCSGG